MPEVNISKKKSKSKPTKRFVKTNNRNGASIDKAIQKRDTYFKAAAK